MEAKLDFYKFADTISECTREFFIDNGIKKLRETIIAEYPSNEFVEYEKMIHQRFHKLRKLMVNYFVHRYGWIIDYLSKEENKYYGILKEPTDILKLTYFDMLDIFMAFAKKDQNIIHNILIKESKNPEFSYVCSTVKDMDESSDKISHYFLIDEIIHTVDFKDNFMNNKNTFFNNYVLFVVLNQELYETIMKNINEVKKMLSLRMPPFLVKEKFCLFDVFPNLIIGGEYDNTVAIENVISTYSSKADESGNSSDSDDESEKKVSFSEKNAVVTI